METTNSIDRTNENKISLENNDFGMILADGSEKNTRLLARWWLEYLLAHIPFGRGVEVQLLQLL